jgi:hypothetical protein
VAFASGMTHNASGCQGDDLDVHVFLFKEIKVLNQWNRFYSDQNITTNMLFSAVLCQNDDI